MNKDHRSKSLLSIKPKETPIQVIKPPIIDINQQKFESNCFLIRSKQTTTEKSNFSSFPEIREN